ncbi:cupin domain-containing protein [Balneolaceae bacterium ANBcel3]|nr:cupin domain-containing protein [Balneolaceae bacterium ANBcel3]
MEKFGYAEKIEKKEVFKGVFGQYLGSGKNMNVMHWNFEDNVSLPAHSHDAEQFGYIIKGGFRVTIDGETQLLKAGDFYFVPSNAEHSFVSVGETEAIDVFSPPKEISM